MTTWTTSLDSPIGRITLVKHGRGLAALGFEGGSDVVDARARADGAAFADELAALGRYFAGEREPLALDLEPAGSDFQRAVWNALRTIPFGATASYGEIARLVGRPTAARAVGAANSRNPIAIAIPCHRVIGRDGSLIGYAGGLERKRWLLRHELRVAS